MSNRVIHFEIPCDDPRKTKAFFETVFQWEFTKYGEEEHWFIKTGNEDEHGINGALAKRRHPAQPIVNSISVDDIDATMKNLETAGGNVVVPKMPIPTMGWLAFFKDPDGNIHGLWQDDKKAE